ncbi:2-succinyl-5-enolpyruvyl-6-hydroxy-3-cyclohexene-1-carboxylic-acid synthase [Vibrio rarus]|uniref:2-succinyl-5-enolpyruvyl-6-hydroxy-3- cyclohexene-1-carboxylic-acid synthase n=1 Tax=Vibrio rarus TaxID=413403 RepID=UPI0021C4B55C|nr:2-succinyl-5-enolpyruvyl-6-hydroxy-3-cyclohexene-1-carboxylic-acid synthase [Vibrio rarus]
MSEVALAELSQAQINRVWSSVILEEACRFGAVHVCIAPGSRSTPLTLEASRNSQLRLHTHYDERGLGFFALGLAKATQQPVIVIVTSGTAVANLLPAVVEAHLTGEKLILLTADRPQELVGVGANQAIIQPGIFSEHVTQALSLPSANVMGNIHWLLSQVDEVLHTQQEKQGPVHINCPFPEPLYTSEECRLANIKELATWLPQQTPFIEKPLSSPGQGALLANFLTEHSYAKGLIILGQLPYERSQQVQQLAQQLGWPILCDPQSGVSSQWQHYDIWLQNNKAKQHLAECEVVVQFGARVVSKRLLQWLKERVSRRGFARYALVSNQGGVLNPDHLPMLRLAEQWPLPVDINNDSPSFGWGDAVCDFALQVDKHTQTLLANELSELEVAYRLPELLDKGYQLFLGNSLGVRLVDMVSQSLNVSAYSNRGASGIDGIIATSAGVSAASEQATLTLIGDTSLLHDINSLPLLAQQGDIVLLFNNDGGAIFDMLPVDENSKQSLYQMPHGYSFKHAAQQFGLHYAQPKTWQQLEQVVANFSRQHGCSLLIEVMTPAGQASTHIKTLVEQLKKG